MPRRDDIQFRRGTAAAWTAANPVLRDGEPGYEDDTGKMKLGDGVTPWNGRPYLAGGGIGADGPAGAAGAPWPGNDGEDGATFVIPGPTGPTGADSLVPGPVGQAAPPWPGNDGEDGYSFVVPGKDGAAGADSVVPGPAGASGVPFIGEPGDDGLTFAIPGKDGSIGVDGAAGAAGASIPFPGNDGEDGMSFLIPGKDGATGPSGGSGTQTAFTKDLGVGQQSGTFDVTGLAGLTTDNSYDVRQSAAAIASKGNARDEAQMDTILCTAYALDATSLRVNWYCDHIQVGTYAFVSIT